MLGKMLARLTDLWRSYLPEQYIGVSATTTTTARAESVSWKSYSNVVVAVMPLVSGWLCSRSIDGDGGASIRCLCVKLYEQLPILAD